MMLTFDLKTSLYLNGRPVTSVSCEIGIPYLKDGSITMRGCVKYIHDPDTTFTFEPQVKFIGLMILLCVQAFFDL